MGLRIGDKSAGSAHTSCSGVITFESCRAKAENCREKRDSCRLNEGWRRTVVAVGMEGFRWIVGAEVTENCRPPAPLAVEEKDGRTEEELPPGDDDDRVCDICHAHFVRMNSAKCYFFCHKSATPSPIDHASYYGYYYYYYKRPAKRSV